MQLNREACIVIGAACDGDTQWTLGGAVCLVLFHRRCLEPGIIQSMADVLMHSPETWTTRRPGDGTLEGAAMRAEAEAMVLERASLLLDERQVTHVHLAAQVSAKQSGGSHQGAAVISKALQANELAITVVLQTEKWDLGPLVLFSKFLFELSELAKVPQTGLAWKGSGGFIPS